jgi:hypothetical protein
MATKNQKILFLDQCASPLPDMRESVSGRNPWELENFTSTVFEMQVKQLMLDTFFKKKLRFRADYFGLT